VFDGTDNYPSINSYIVKGGRPGTGYTFRVRAKYNNGMTGYSSESVLFTCTTPIGIKAPTVIATDSTSFTLSWS
jgi:hypothetical protein